MSHTQSERALILFFRLAMAWTFLYAASHQVFVQWSVAGFLDSTKTFHGFYSQFTGPQIAPFLTFVVGYGHLLIGLSLLFGLMVRVSSVFGILLMLTALAVTLAHAPDRSVESLVVSGAQMRPHRLLMAMQTAVMGLVPASRLFSSMSASIPGGRAEKADAREDLVTTGKPRLLAAVRNAGNADFRRFPLSRMSGRGRTVRRAGTTS